MKYIPNARLLTKPSGAKYKGQPPCPSANPCRSHLRLWLQEAGYVLTKVGMANSTISMTGVKKCVSDQIGRDQVRQDHHGEHRIARRALCRSAQAP